MYSRLTYITGTVGVFRLQLPMQVWALLTLWRSTQHPLEKQHTMALLSLNHSSRLWILTRTSPPYIWMF